MDKTKNTSSNFLNELSSSAYTSDLSIEIADFIKKQISSCVKNAYKEIKTKLLELAKSGKFNTNSRGNKYISLQLSELQLSNTFSKSIIDKIKQEHIDKLSTDELELMSTRFNLRVIPQFKKIENTMKVLGLFKKTTITPIPYYDNYSKLYLEEFKKLADADGLKLKVFFKSSSNNLYTNDNIYFDKYYSISENLLNQNPNGLSELIKGAYERMKTPGLRGYTILELTAEFD